MSEPETDAADGVQVPGVGGVVAELLAKTADVYVQGLGRTEPVDVPDLVDQPLAGDHAARVAHQQCQQIELLARELERLAVERRGPSRRVELDRADPDRVAAGRVGR